MRTALKAADHSTSTAAMKIGDLVLYQGRPYYLRGLDPISVPDRGAFLEDAFSGEERTAPLDHISSEEADGPQRPAGV
jgi:hypothetical protein